MATPLQIRIKKSADGRTSLSCTRADGTTTWQRQQGSQAAFFPRHDLTHYAVENALGLESGFFPLVACGWDLTDFGTPWPRGPLPLAANVSEMIVSFFDRERASGELGTAADLNEVVRSYCVQHGIGAPTFDDSDVARVRQARGALFQRWDALSSGEALELSFEQK
ncbi:MAG: hypothetical protein H0T21_11030 [Gemmatimonadaceae bacterium]|nr:hypothetical protein [Gemmatimonadaceae bacterium]